jgi:hypothetical protein
MLLSGTVPATWAEYTVYPLAGIRRAEGYAEQVPEAVLAVSVAGDPIGNELGFLLDPDDDLDLRLGSELQLFEHEEGVVLRTDGSW